MLGGITQWQDWKISTTLYVYERMESGYGEPIQIIEVDGEVTSLALYGDILAVGTPFSNGLMTRSGRIQIYRRSASGIWEFNRSLLATGQVEQLGMSIAFDGDRLLANAQERGGERKPMALFYQLSK